MTSFFAWNMRGFNMTRKNRALRAWVQQGKPSFGCLVETRVQESNHPKCMLAAMELNHLLLVSSFGQDLGMLD